LFFPHDISKTDSARITKLDKEMLHDESWKPVYFGVKKVKGQGHESQKIAGVGLRTLVSAGFFSCKLRLSVCKLDVNGEYSSESISGLIATLLPFIS